MAHVPIEDLLKRCGSIYKLVILASKRAKELADGSPALVDTSSKKVTTIALEEILQGKVRYKGNETASSGKKGRGKKEEKKKRAA